MAYLPSWPRSFSHPFGGSSEAATSTAFADLIYRIGPPWLQRTWAVRFLSALATPIDVLADAMVASVRARFPVWTDPTALSRIGDERRIQRGPTEPAHVYARRLLTWWDDHRGRGGPYALLRQLRAYWLDTVSPPIDLVSHSGTKHSIDAAGVITRELITWGADASAEWAQFWVFLYLAADPGTLTADQEAAYLLVPREWTAAHILRQHVVLVWGSGRLWDYPVPTGDWDAWATGGTWDDWDAEAPIVLTHTET